jgi:hypothetical protein
MATVWEHFESLVLQFLEDRTSELLTRGDVASSPKLVAHVRETAAWSASRAVARFQLANDDSRVPSRDGRARETN